MSRQRRSRSYYFQAFNRRISFLEQRIAAMCLDCGEDMSYDRQELKALKWFRDQYIDLSDENDRLRTIMGGKRLPA